MAFFWFVMFVVTAVFLSFYHKRIYGTWIWIVIINYLKDIIEEFKEKMKK